MLFRALAPSKRWQTQCARLQIWHETLMRTIVDKASAFPSALVLKHKEDNPNRKSLWAVPVLFAAQVLIYLGLQALAKRDLCYGNKTEEYDELNYWCASCSLPRCGC